MQNFSSPTSDGGGRPFLRRIMHTNIYSFLELESSGFGSMRATEMKNKSAVVSEDGARENGKFNEERSFRPCYNIVGELLIDG